MIKKGRIKQSLVHWCYAPYWGIEQMIQVAKQLGCGS
ncbi:MAG: hydroxypyruvate isomerase, partial [Planctomycetaceae bacterium]|nr:hydroxypyruvate isomerase [Planctomycetaceae bacterium]